MLNTIGRDSRTRCEFHIIQVRHPVRLMPRAAYIEEGDQALGIRMIYRDLRANT